MAVISYVKSQGQDFEVYPPRQYQAEIIDITERRSTNPDFKDQLMFRMEITRGPYASREFVAFITPSLHERGNLRKAGWVTAFEPEWTEGMDVDPDEWIHEQALFTLGVGKRQDGSDKNIILAVTALSGHEDTAPPLPRPRGAVADRPRRAVPLPEEPYDDAPLPDYSDDPPPPPRPRQPERVPSIAERRAAPRV